MSLYNMYETDHDLEKGGIILNYGEGVRIKIARAGGSNAVFVKTLEKATRPYRKQMESGTLSDDVANDLFIQVFAESVVKDWENVTDRDGNDLQFSVDNCVKLFKDLPDLFSDVRNAASDVSNFRVEELENDIKN
jgi:hypothetical protein